MLKKLTNHFAYLKSVKREEGQSILEYALILALISIVAIIALRALGISITNIFEKINDALM